MSLVSLCAELQRYGIGIDRAYRPGPSSNECETQAILIPSREIVAALDELPSFHAELLRWQVPLDLLRDGGADPRWPLSAHGGMPLGESKAVLRQFHRARHRSRDDTSLYWVVRKCPRSTVVLDLLADIDDCLEAAAADESLKPQERRLLLTERFEQCIGRRYRIESRAAWEQRPPYWKEILPDG